MAEDSFLVNFDTAPGGVGPALSSRLPHVKGGRWKDRVKAKRQAKHRANKGVPKDLTATTTERPSEDRRGGRTRESVGESRTQPEAHFDFEHRRQGNLNLKRKRHPDDNGRYSSGARSNWHQSRTGSGHGKGQGQVISSLFSSNPDPDAGAEAELEPEVLEPAAPTNAPLDDGSEFSTLGLTPSLSSHLANKMNLKAPTSIQRVAVPQLITSDSDAFIQAETGSGKTLSYLLPLIHRITASRTTTNNPGQKLHRDSGCFAIILAPTRELGRQIHFVLNQVLSQPSLHWIVPILLLGGEKKKSEKARLRKGGNILVATPGRLADHLQNTKSLDVAKVRWVILDEGDRLMDLGFEETIRTILDLLKERCGSSSNTAAEGPALVPSRRVTILCSATMQGNVQRLGEISLSEALFLTSEQGDNTVSKESDGDTKNGEFSAPAQLQQSYVITPAKLRLVTLAAILKRAFVRQGQTTKVVVFFCCGQSVDFHLSALSAHLDDKIQKKDDESHDVNEGGGDDNSDASPADVTATITDPLSRALSLDPSVQLHKLHGSLKQSIRTATMSSFLHGKGSAVLLCTDIAARGLDLPNVDLVVQYDPPFSKEDYVHRIGRTARAGRDGRAMLFLMPGSEERYASEVLTNMKITRKTAAEVLKLGFGTEENGSTKNKSGGSKRASKPVTSSSSSSHADGEFIPMTSGEMWAEEATQFHLNLERWALADAENLALARRGFQSFVGAYATHIASERSIFDLKALHLGHVAKSFCLRDKPADIKLKSVKPDAPVKEQGGRSRGTAAAGHGQEKQPSVNKSGDEEAHNNAKRMMAKMRMHMSAISEFNIG